MSLFTSLRSTAESLSAFDQALSVTQDNVSNASTPGYAKQQVTLEALEFGGVRAGPVTSARDQFAEQSVRRQVSSWGYSQQQTETLSALQNVFDISGNSGLPNALSNLFQSFSSWSQNAQDPLSRQTVIDRATDTATAFQQTASALASSAHDTESQIQQTVTTVNDLVGQLKTLNQKSAQDPGNNPALDSQVNSVEEQLAEYVNFTAMRQSDGTVTILMNGQTPLLIGDRQYNLNFRMDQPTTPAPTISNAPPRAFVTASDGTDITTASTGGRLGALLDVRNRLIPSYIGDAYQAGSLNEMAKQFADRVNSVLQSGQVSGGATPQSGSALFQYDTTNDTRAAESIAVAPGMSASQLAAIDPGPPAVSNGIPLALAALANPTSDADRINGVSYNAFFGQMASGVGSDLNAAKADAETQQSLVVQARNLRQQSSGVSLDEEAAQLIQFQRAYEANSRLITVLDSLTQDTINMLQP
jgi:flagellar hook-associated protein 1 FlgK